MTTILSRLAVLSTLLGGLFFITAGIDFLAPAPGLSAILLLLAGLVFLSFPLVFSLTHLVLSRHSR